MIFQCFCNPGFGPDGSGGRAGLTVEMSRVSEEVPAMGLLALPEGCIGCLSFKHERERVQSV